MSIDHEIDHSSQRSLDIAREEGLRIVVPTARQLFIDIDNDTDYERFCDAYDRAYDLGFVSGYSERPSKSGEPGHRHIIVSTPLVVETPLMRIALQAILGSDWKRELWSLKRLQEHDAIPTLFYEKPE